MYACLHTSKTTQTLPLCFLLAQLSFPSHLVYNTLIALALAFPQLKWSKQLTVVSKLSFERSSHPGRKQLDQELTVNSEQDVEELDKIQSRSEVRRNHPESLCMLRHGWIKAKSAWARRGKKLKTLGYEENDVRGKVRGWGRAGAGARPVVQLRTQLGARLSRGTAGQSTQLQLSKQPKSKTPSQSSETTLYTDCRVKAWQGLMAFL